MPRARHFSRRIRVRSIYHIDMETSKFYVVPPVWRTFDASDTVLSRVASVYGWKRGEVWLYVGRARNPLARVTNHDIVGRATPFLPHDKIVVWRSRTEDDARELERELIARLHPVFNVRGRGAAICVKCSGPFVPRRPWQRYCSRDCRRTKITVNVDLEAEIRERR